MSHEQEGAADKTQGPGTSRFLNWWAVHIPNLCMATENYFFSSARLLEGTT